MYPLLQMPKERHIFKAGSSFKQVMMLYRFDKKLRLLLFNEIEKIEIAVRSAIVNIGSKMFGDPFWMTNNQNFINQAKFNKSMSLIDTEMMHSREEFIIHFEQTYSNPYPPAWILSEILPIGVITNIYSNIRDNKVKKAIAQAFGMQVPPFESWMTIITLTRNSCCHHARIWNKQNTIRPTVPKKLKYPWITLPCDPLRTYFNICIVRYFVNVISPGNDMLDKLKGLFAQFPDVDLSAIGFPQGWEKEPLWDKQNP
jgi:abortive infection bacteriophage resistance protein